MPGAENCDDASALQLYIDHLFNLMKMYFLQMKKSFAIQGHITEFPAEEKIPLPSTKHPKLSNDSERNNSGKKMQDAVKAIQK